MRLSTTLPVFLLFTSLSLSAQFITAGQYQPGQYYVDLQPDTTIEAPWAIFTTQAYLPLDMNGDSVVDFELHVYKSDGLGSNYIHCYIEPKNNNEVAISTTDSCFALDDCGWLEGLWWVYGMVRAFEYGEQIDGNAQWADSLVYLSYNTYSGGCFYCGAHTFEDTATSYIGVRFFTATDTVYGWIKVSGVTETTCTIEAIAGESATTGTSEGQINALSVLVSPNPASGRLRFDFGRALPANTVLRIWDNMNRPVLQQELESGARTFNFDVAPLPGGVYYYSVRVGVGETTSGKFLVRE